jgi:hypothetical protein
MAKEQDDLDEGLSGMIRRIPSGLDDLDGKGGGMPEV